MNKFVKNAGLFDTQIGKIIIDVVSQCENCKRFKKHTPRPVVVLPYNNHLITIMPLKIRNDVKCSYDTAVAWTISAKISLINHNGFSPSQIVFEKTVT